MHVDPGSPAAKEYALPLNQARQTGQASTRATGSSSGGGSTALFGAGIKPARSGDGAGSGGSTPAARPAQGAVAPTTPHTGDSSAGGASSQSALPATLARAASSQSSTGGNSALLALVAGGLAILVLGGLGGTVLRRNRDPTAHG